MQEFITNNPTETIKVAEDLAGNLGPGQVIALAGNLGAGKTVFVKALAQKLGIKETITSPTFVLLKVYNLDFNNIKTFVHVDCYRLDEAENLADIGLQDYLEDSTALVIIEWADKLHNLPTNNLIKITIESQGGDKRKITIEN
jgi:tRNA threonylcarbamoyladenosine biosynthesis protein TsaE